MQPVCLPVCLSGLFSVRLGGPVSEVVLVYTGGQGSSAARLREDRGMGGLWGVGGMKE